MIVCEGAFVAVGGWSRRGTLFGGDDAQRAHGSRAIDPDPLLDPAFDAARIRAYFVAPSHARRGLASRLMRRCAIDRSTGPPTNRPRVDTIRVALTGCRVDRPVASHRPIDHDTDPVLRPGAASAASIVPRSIESAIERGSSVDGAETLAAVADAIELSASIGLVYVSDSDPGFRRVRRGQRFAYLNADDRPLKDAKELQRIASLAIPPAYEKVWVCAKPRGHLQATGYDARGRKQYRYHPEWRTARDGAKFERMIEFGDALPGLRRRLGRDLGLSGLPRDKVLATVVSLLDATRIRIGNAEYARDNASFGLTTLKDKHVRFVMDGRARFSFKGKGGIEHDVTIDDRRLSRIVRRCQHVPGQQLFQYLDDDGSRHPITSDLVNAYLQDAMGEDFTAKDFRTWSATMSAIALMAATPLPEAPSERAFKAAVVAAIKAVAEELRNTPTVARKSYINPVVFTAWRSGALHKAITGDLKSAPRKAEKFALAFLRAESRAATRAAKKAVASSKTRRRANVAAG